MGYLILSLSWWIGISGGILTTASLAPPLIKLIKEKKSEQVPLGMLVILLVGISLWLVYGILKKDWPLLITNGVSLIQNLVMLTLRHKYKSNK
jgi:MtN3 and saliva related transmembrane protein